MHGGWDAGNLRSPHIRPHGQGLSARGQVQDGCLMWNLKLPPPHPFSYGLRHNLWPAASVSPREAKDCESPAASPPMPPSCTTLPIKGSVQGVGESWYSTNISQQPQQQAGALQDSAPWSWEAPDYASGRVRLR